MAILYKIIGSLFNIETIGWTISTNIFQLIIQNYYKNKNMAKEKREDIRDMINYFLKGLPKMGDDVDEISTSFYNKSINDIALLLHKYDKVMRRNERDEFTKTLRLERIDIRITRCRQLLERVKNDL